MKFGSSAAAGCHVCIPDRSELVLLKPICCVAVDRHRFRAFGSRIVGSRDGYKMLTRRPKGCKLAMLGSFGQTRENNGV